MFDWWYWFSICLAAVYFVLLFRQFHTDLEGGKNAGHNNNKKSRNLILFMHWFFVTSFSEINLWKHCTLMEKCQFRNCSATTSIFYVPENAFVVLLHNYLYFWTAKPNILYFQTNFCFFLSVFVCQQQVNLPLEWKETQDGRGRFYKLDDCIAETYQILLSFSRRIWYF